LARQAGGRVAGSARRSIDVVDLHLLVGCSGAACAADVCGLDVMRSLEDRRVKGGRWAPRDMGLGTVMRRPTPRRRRLLGICSSAGGRRATASTCWTERGRTGPCCCSMAARVCVGSSRTRAGGGTGGHVAQASTCATCEVAGAGCSWLPESTTRPAMMPGRTRTPTFQHRDAHGGSASLPYPTVTVIVQFHMRRILNTISQRIYCGGFSRGLHSGRFHAYVVPSFL
jgi:hypothetical protein